LCKGRRGIKGRGKERVEIVEDRGRRFKEKDKRKGEGEGMVGQE